MKTISSNRLSARILKTMSIFGGVQVVNIVCSVIRTKLVALWIGAAGVGLFALFNSAIDMIGAFSRLELRSSSVREIASAGSRLEYICVVVRRWSWMLGIAGAFLMIILSPFLSQWTFGDDNHTLSFIILSVTIMLFSITDGENAILQGTSMLKELARSSMIGVAVSVAISIPLFYFFKIDGILPAIISYFIVTATVTFIFRRKPQKPIPKISVKETITEGTGFISLGIYMTVSVFMGLLVSYIFMAYLNWTADTSTVGHYQAGFSLVNRYMGLLFAAIAMEYYPRLAQVIDSRMRTSVFVSHEMKIAIWILIPVIAFFITFNKLIVNIFYSSEFEIIIPFITLAVVGTIFRAIALCLTYTILARGDGKFYLLTEAVSALTGLSLNVIFYNTWGFYGLGFSYILWFLTYAISVALVYRVRYRLKLGYGIGRLILFALATSSLCLLLSFFVGWWATLAVAVITSFFTAKRLIRRH